MEIEQPRQQLKEQKGLLIAKEGSIKKLNDKTWRVRSQTRTNKEYTIKLTPDGPMCSCPDWEKYENKCKHIYAMDYLARNSREDINDKETPIIRKPTYSQNWSAYNTAQTKEKREFMKLLADLIFNICWEEYDFGRPNTPVSDILYAMIFKVYSQLSGRKFASDLNDAKEKEYVYQNVAYNTVFKYFQSGKLTDYLTHLVALSASPMQDIEKDFAIDSTGFGTSKFQRWFSYKHQKDVRTRKWVKCHFMCGTLTNIVTSVKITTEFEADTNQFKELVDLTNEKFEMKEVSADKAYQSRANYDLIDSIGGKAYIPFKKNSTGKARGSPVWRKAYHEFMANYDEFMEHYHKRSNVETTVNMIKAKFGDYVKSKVWTAQVNEVLCKIICHNICVVIHEMENLAIIPNYENTEFSFKV